MKPQKGIFMKKVLITIASLAAVIGIILLNALTFSGRYARMMETSITITTADSSFLGQKMKEFFARDDLKEKLTNELDALPLFPGHHDWHEELASQAVAAGQEASLEQVRCQGRHYYGGYRIRLSIPADQARLWKERWNSSLSADRLESMTNSESSHIRLRHFTGWEEISDEHGIPCRQGTADFLLTGGGMTQLVYITAVVMEKEDTTVLTLFLSDHKQDTKGIPFAEMAEKEST